MNTQSKLYTFTVDDSNNFPIEKVLQFANELCADRAPFHGWAPGFTVQLVGNPITNGGIVVYTFSVYGEYLEGAEPAEESFTTDVKTERPRYVAQPTSSIV